MGAGIPPSLRLFNDCDDEEIPAMVDGSGLAEAMLGLVGVRSDRRVRDRRRGDDRGRNDRAAGVVCALWVSGGVPGPGLGRCARSGVLRSPDTVADLEAAVAVPGGVVLGEDVDRSPSSSWMLRSC